MQIDLNTKQFECLASKVHDAWWQEKASQGFHAPRDCDTWPGTECGQCHNDMIPYADLPDNVKNFDRVIAQTVLSAIEELQTDERKEVAF